MNATPGLPGPPGGIHERAHLPDPFQQSFPSSCLDSRFSLTVASIQNRHLDRLLNRNDSNGMFLKALIFWCCPVHGNKETGTLILLIARVILNMGETESMVPSQLLLSLRWAPAGSRCRELFRCLTTIYVTSEEICCHWREARKRSRCWPRGDPFAGRQLDPRHPAGPRASFSISALTNSLHSLSMIRRDPFVGSGTRSAYILISKLREWTWTDTRPGYRSSRQASQPRAIETLLLQKAAQQSPRSESGSREHLRSITSR